MKRRTFLISAALSAAASTFLGRIAVGVEKIQEQFTIHKSNFWNGEFFHQTRVDNSREDKNIIRARIQGKWENYKMRELDNHFIEWNIQDRLEKLSTMRGGKMPDWSGAHNAAVATYGKNRGDSRFTLNNAVKGMGLCPKKERLGEIINKLKQTRNEPMTEKFNVLESLYKDKTLWDYRKLLSLELYSNPDFETHTFLNQMSNPISTIIFLDIPSYEIRTVVKLFHPKDPDLTEYEKQIVTYTNTIHTYMHSHFKSVVPAALYYVIEEFNNSPGRGGKGKRVI